VVAGIRGSSLELETLFDRLLEEGRRTLTRDSL
jgi:hypothetical protein